MITVMKFESDTCRPCKAFAPVFEEFADENMLTVTYVNVEDHPALAEAHNVSSLPTTIFFRDNEEYARLIGALPRTQLEIALNS